MNVALFTTDNRSYHEALAAAGHAVRDFDLNAAGGVKGLAAEPSWDIAVIEGSGWDGSHAALLGNLAARGRVICMARSVETTLRRDLLAHGVADLIAAEHPRHLAAYLKAIEGPVEESRGLIAVLDDAPNTRRAAETIIRRFNCAPIFVDSVSGLCDVLARHNVVLTLLNLGTTGLDLPALIRTSYANRDLRRVPLLAYKDMDRGLFVHEVISGLNRLTRFILSPEELYSFLVDLLFRKEMVTNLAKFNRHADVAETSFFATDSLDRIVFMKGPDLFEFHNIMLKENYADMVACTAEIRRTLLRADGLRWLRLDYDSRSVSTVGMAAPGGV